jgi:hypothetical protein
MNLAKHHASGIRPVAARELGGRETREAPELIDEM